MNRLIELLAEMPPAYKIPFHVVHAHSRHYVPQFTVGNVGLLVDGFVRLRTDDEIVVAWRDVKLDDDMRIFLEEIAGGIHYLGRSESWTECAVLREWNGKLNWYADHSAGSECDGYLMAALSASAYSAQRKKILVNERRRIEQKGNTRRSDRQIERMVTKSFTSKSGVYTLPERLLDALSVDTGDWQETQWNRPPPSHDVPYRCTEDAAGRRGSLLLNVNRRFVRPRAKATVARYLLAGRPRPRVEDTVRIGEVMRLATLSRFGWDRDERSERRVPRAPWQISGRDEDGRPLRSPEHHHAYWLPEDADDDGFIDHLTVFVPGGIDHGVEEKLDHVNRLWLERPRLMDEAEKRKLGAGEWRLALEGFGQPPDFGADGGVLGRSDRWRSATPFLAGGHLKKDGYAGEFRRLFQRTEAEKRLGISSERILIRTLPTITVGGRDRRTLDFRRTRSRGREAQHDAMGVFLEIQFPSAVRGPFAWGYGSHFGLGLFRGVK